MTREDFIKKEGNVIELLYAYYIEKCEGNCQDFQTFLTVINATFMKPGGEVFKFDTNLAYNRVKEYYNQKFGIVRLFSKDNKILKVI